MTEQKCGRAAKDIMYTVVNSREKTGCHSIMAFVKRVKYALNLC